MKYISIIFATRTTRTMEKLILLEKIFATHYLKHLGSIS